VLFLIDFKSVLYFRLARHALYFFLKNAGFKKCDLVLLPDFICKDLIAVFHALEITPVFYSVSKNLEPINLNRYSNIKAVLAVNYFGFPQKIDLYRDYCEKNGCILIEDNAHGFLSADDSGMLLGTRGDVGIFSFRKTFLLPDGAGLLINNKSLRMCSTEQPRFVTGYLGLSFYAKYLFNLIQIKLGVNVLARFRHLVRFFRKVKTGYKVVPPDSASEYTLPTNHAPHLAILNMLKSQNFTHEIKRRRYLFVQCQMKLAQLKIEPLHYSLGENTCPYGYPFFADDAEAIKVIKIAESMGFDCVKWPDLPNQVFNTSPDFYKKLWMINFTC
jgi:dTDP-4-amino-4,6-dideoxygalactose transaminase